MISKTAKKYCGEDISLIENYEQAIADTNQFWDCHHRLEIQEDKKLTSQDLKDLGLYYNRPANELIFLTHEEHSKLHGKVWTEIWKGKRFPAKERKPKEKTERKPLTIEQRKRLSEGLKGNKNNFGKHLSDSQKKICGNAIRGKTCYTNGIINVFRDVCPEGFWKGKTSTKKTS